jgi:hypothetical protein
MARMRLSWTSIPSKTALGVRTERGGSGLAKPQPTGEYLSQPAIASSYSSEVDDERPRAQVANQAGSHGVPEAYSAPKDC